MAQKDATEFARKYMNRIDTCQSMFEQVFARELHRAWWKKGNFTDKKSPLADLVAKLSGDSMSD